MSENIKAFDHKPDKYGPDGRVMKRDLYSCHVVSGQKFYQKLDAPGKFYTEGGLFIPLEEVPDVCKRNLGSVPKPKEVAGTIKKLGSESKEPSSLV